MIFLQPDRDEFARRCWAATVVPVYCSILSDQLTPVSAFDRLSRNSAHAFLLESVIGGEKIARYSFLSAEPFAVVEGMGKRTAIASPDGQRVRTDVDPLAELETLLQQYRSAPLADLPRFLGGAVGYAGYDTVRHYEKLGRQPTDDRGIPDVLFGIYDTMVVFDHVRKLIHVVAHAHVGDGVDQEKAYDEAAARITGIVETLTEMRPDPVRPYLPTAGGDAGRYAIGGDAGRYTIGGDAGHSSSGGSAGGYTSGGDAGSAKDGRDAVAGTAYESTFARSDFEQAVERCRDYIRAGDILQVVLAQRFTAETDVDPFDIYRALRVINPSPFMFYLKSPAVTLVGASPEILCRLEGSTVSTRPLAGTRPRGRNEAEDLGLEAELLADPKERAEHVMLVDLGRNDLGRVCEPGSVKIDDLMSIERYSHVMHICSNVSGTIAANRSAFDALRSVLPVGTVSGAPKIRAMQIIDELEPVRRGAYAGAVGYVDFGGNMDTCIALRTLVITPGENGKYRVDAQVGAGVVADSEPAREYDETVNKAQAMLRAVDLASAWQSDVES